jgi:riboflavin-specific deaminase-like protein
MTRSMSINQQIESWLESRKLSFPETKRPFITLAFAQAWDGSITTDKGSTVILSNTESSTLTHQLRSLHDGILVGIETVLSDDPQLTVRLWSGKNPQPIVLDSRLRMPPAAKLCQHPDSTCWLLTLQAEMDEEAFDGVKIIRVNNSASGKPAAEKGEADFVPLAPAMDKLKSLGINSLMVEGGARVLTEFLKAELADAIVMTMAPKILGGYKAIGDLGITSYSNLPVISQLNAEKLGSDLIVWGDIQYGDPSV